MIGCMISFYKNRHRLLDWYTDLLSVAPTQTITVSRLGARRAIVTANPKNVEYILKTNFCNFPKGKPFQEILEDFLGNGIFNVDGDLWYNQRKLASQEFSAKSLRDYVVNSLKEEVDSKLLPLLESLANDTNKTLDLQDLLRRVTFDVVCKVSLGHDPCCLDHYSLQNSPRIIEAFDMASEICARRGAAPLSALWKVKKFVGIGSEKRLKEAIVQIHIFVGDIIHDKKRKLSESRRGDDEQDLLSKMILGGNEEDFMRDMMISFIMAGRDTTSAAMTWLFYLFSCHSDVEHEVVKELGFVVNNDNEKLSQYEILKELKFLKSCICESMRLYPPVAWDSKHALSDDVLPDGTPVRAGDRVTYVPYGMGRMENLWGKDRFNFKPERWISEMEQGRIKALKNICPYKFPVFQAGPRVCLGKEFAFIQMKYIVASILKRFKFRPVSSDRPVFVPLLTAHLEGGLNVFVQKRVPRSALEERRFLFSVLSALDDLVNQLDEAIRNEWAALDTPKGENLDRESEPLDFNITINETAAAQPTPAEGAHDFHKLEEEEIVKLLQSDAVRVGKPRDVEASKESCGIANVAVGNMTLSGEQRPDDSDILVDNEVLKSLRKHLNMTKSG
ncbi:unnamed protein product [Fraxinus pennsylvanica]|uniref:Cytochrome P450 n=1 Tax=Fraxinus pennsylvanica TaxID=56036 RepID=A0AAD2DTC1_9LAMI|nr:unnamed protein product [Fraxinus pennsylvanica]